MTIVQILPVRSIASCGETVAQAKKNLTEVILINLEEAGKLGTLPDLLHDAGLEEVHGVFMARKELIGFTPTELAV